eukprot:m.88644 g.88644  ORF g.88644 m.88644 type:complete len:105 (+) comp16434_c0_seq2:133-447(+)
MVDANTRKTLAAIPLHKVNAGPRDGDKWKDRLKEELMALIMYVKKNKEEDNDWFKLESNPEGTRLVPMFTSCCCSACVRIPYVSILLSSAHAGGTDLAGLLSMA